MKGTFGCCQTVMNDLGAQQSSQMFLTWVWPDHNTGDSVPYSLRIVCGFFNISQLFTSRVVRRDLRLMALILTDLKVDLTICWCNYKGSTFCSVIFKTVSVGPAGVKLTTSRMITRCSTNWATGGGSYRYYSQVLGMSTVIGWFSGRYSKVLTARFYVCFPAQFNFQENIKHLTKLVFSVYIVSYSTLFSSSIHGPCASHPSYKLKWKKWGL